MLKEAKERHLEIPDFRDVYPEVLKIREEARKNHEYDTDEAGSMRVPSTVYLCDWLDQINKVRDQQVEDVYSPQNFEEEKLVVLSTIVFNMVLSIQEWNLGYTLDNNHASSILFTPCEGLKKELEEKGYWVEETNQTVIYDHNDIEHEAKSRYIHMRTPKEYQTGNWAKIF